MSKTLFYSLSVGVFIFSIVAFAANNRFPILEKIPQKPKEAIASLLEWQTSLDELKVSEVYAKFGKPDFVKNLGINSVTGKPMQTLSYRISRRSELQITIHEEKVVVATTILLPSANESGPFDD